MKNLIPVMLFMSLPFSAYALRNVKRHVKTPETKKNIEKIDLADPKRAAAFKAD